MIIRHDILMIIFLFNFQCYYQMSNYEQAKEWLTKAVDADCKTEEVFKVVSNSTEHFKALFFSIVLFLQAYCICTTKPCDLWKQAYAWWKKERYDLFYLYDRFRKQYFYFSVCVLTKKFKRNSSKHTVVLKFLTQNLNHSYKCYGYYNKNMFFCIFRL